MSRRLAAALLVALPWLCACAHGGLDDSQLTHPSDATPQVEPLSRYGNPAAYTVNGRRYKVLQSSAGYVARGLASWYGGKFHGRRASSGETYDMHAMTAAHPTLPLPTYVLVKNLKNGRKAIVKVNDRGPFYKGRLIDLSYAAARKLGIVATGTGLVEVRALDPRTSLLEQVAVDTDTRSPRYLQVGAFSRQENAQKLMREIRQWGIHNVHLLTADPVTRLRFRVRIGPLASDQAVDAVVGRLKDRGMYSYRLILN